MCYAGLEVEIFVPDLYKRENYIKTYKNTIDPIHGSEMWPKIGFPLMSALVFDKKGRVKKLRKRSAGEEDDVRSDGTKKMPRGGGNVTCSYCMVLGHSIRKCPNKPVELDGPTKNIVTCSLCKNTGHNKRKCSIKPPKDTQGEEPSIASHPIASESLVKLGADMLIQKKSRQGPISVSQPTVSTTLPKRVMFNGKMMFDDGDKSKVATKVHDHMVNANVGSQMFIGSKREATKQTVNIGSVKITSFFFNQGKSVVTKNSLQAVAKHRGVGLQHVVLNNEDLV